MPEPMTRRRFFLNLAVASGLVLCSRCIAFADGPPCAWVAAGPAEKILPGAFTKVEANGERAFVTRAADGKSFLALYARCTHMGCNVDFRDKETPFVCPCHGGRFDGHGTAVHGPARRPLTLLATKVDDHGMLYVSLPVTPPIVD